MCRKSKKEKVVSFYCCFRDPAQKTIWPHSMSMGFYNNTLTTCNWHNVGMLVEWFCVKLAKWLVLHGTGHEEWSQGAPQKVDAMVCTFLRCYLIPFSFLSLATGIGGTWEPWWFTTGRTQTDIHQAEASEYLWRGKVLKLDILKVNSSKPFISKIFAPCAGHRWDEYWQLPVWTSWAWWWKTIAVCQGPMSNINMMMCSNYIIRISPTCLHPVDLSLRPWLKYSLPLRLWSTFLLASGQCWKLFQWPNGAVCFFTHGILILVKKLSMVRQGNTPARAKWKPICQVWFGEGTSRSVKLWKSNSTWPLVPR